jgi:non-specific serine/threonine protein kinase/serine/threonine-protein kinase
MEDINVLREQEVFEACLDLPADEQERYLASACGRDSRLQERVHRLLAAHASAERATMNPLAALAVDAMPDIIGPYHVVGLLGEGGMGVVYEAEQQHPVRRRVALKIVKIGMDTRQVVTRFMAERQALAAMDHPYVAKVFDAGQTVAGRPYFVMEIVRGEPLLDFCDRRRLGIRERIALFILICQAVQHAHHKGVIHRDLKPSNLLVSASETGPVPKVIDFGIAKAVGRDSREAAPEITLSGQMLGTPAYMSPEQAGRELDVDTRTDVFSLGVILYELLTGALPVDPATTGQAAFLDRLSAGALNLPRPSARTVPRRIARDLDWIVMKALEMNRARRYDTVIALADDLRRFLNAEPVSARQPTVAYRLQKFVRRHRVQVAAAAIVAAALAAGAIGAGFGLVRATRAEAVAREEAATATAVSDFLTGLFGASDPNARETTTLRDLLERGAARVETELKGQPRVQANVLGTLGHVYSSLGMHREAVGLGEKALAVDPDASSGTQNTAEVWLFVGRSQQNLGNFPRAREAFARALAIRTRLLGEHSLEAAAVLNHLGGLHSQLEQYEESIAAHSRALAIQQRQRGPDHVAVTNSLRGLGIVHSRRKQFETALGFQQQTLAILRKTFGDNHPVTASAYETVGFDLKDLNRLSEARSHLERALDIKRGRLGPNHPELAFCYVGLGQVLAKSGDAEGAERLYLEALRIRESTLGPENPRVGDTLTSLGLVQARLGRSADGRASLERALKVYEKSYGPSHSRTLNAKKHLLDINNALVGAAPR